MAQDTAEYEDAVQKMYVAYYGRPGDPAGIDFWAGKLAESNGDLGAIIDSFGTSAEYEDRFSGLDTAGLVNNIYQQLLNRDADSGGLDFYVDRITSGQFTLASAALNIADGIVSGSDAELYAPNWQRPTYSPTIFGNRAPTTGQMKLPTRLLC